MNKLREQMQADFQLIGITPKTQHIYLREVGNLARYFDKSPELLGESELKEYLLYLLKERNLSHGTFRFYVASLKFLYRTTLKRQEVLANIRYPKRKKALPVVLDLSEVEALFSVTENMKHKAILMITYSAGLRISETSPGPLQERPSEGVCSVNSQSAVLFSVVPLFLSCAII